MNEQFPCDSHRRGAGYTKDQKLWDSFQDPPAPQTDGSLLENQRFDVCKKVMKAVAYVLVFAVILCTGVASKISLLLMTTNIASAANTTYCDYKCGWVSAAMRCV